MEKKVRGPSVKFIGRWRLVDSTLELCADGTWTLISGETPVPMFNLLEEKRGKWTYSHRGRKVYRFGVLLFALEEGGRGFFVRVMGISEREIKVADGAGGVVKMRRFDEVKI